MAEVETTDYLRFIASLVLVLGLIMGTLWALRRFGVAGMVPRAPGQRRRLIVVESLSLDARRRLVLVRRDETEHLLLLGGNGDVVVEQGIAPRPAGSQEEAQ